MLVARILPLQEITLKLKIHFLLGKSEELVQSAFMLLSSGCCDDDLFPEVGTQYFFHGSLAMVR
jgi:hypothetical protein